MSISSKLATDFVKRNFNVFEFESRPKKASAIDLNDVYDTHVRVDGIEINPFSYDSECIGCITVILPARLKANRSSLEKMLRQIKREDMDMKDIIAGPTYRYRVTTNRLIVLEELMKKSGLFKASQETFHFDTSKAMIEDESGNTVEALNQANLSDIEGVIINGVKYYPALDVEKLCYKADKLYTSIKKEHDRIKKDYEKAYKSLDPKFIEAQSKMLQLSKDLSVTSLETINTIIDKLTEMCKK